MKRIKLTAEQKETRRRVIDLTHQLKLSHLGSCLSTIDIIDAVYRVKKGGDRFVLSSGHSAIALYVILEKNRIIDMSVIKKLHIHPDRNMDHGIHVSSGSLGQGLPIAVGMALADRKRRVFCVISDGECAEGSIWEALKIIYENKVSNLVTIVNANGWGAYDPIALPALLKRIKGFGSEVIRTDGHDLSKLTSALKQAGKSGPSIIFARTEVEQLPFLKGQDAHYYVMNDNDHRTAMELLK
jgi:transketolase